MKRLCLVVLVILGHQALASPKRNVPLLVRHQAMVGQNRIQQLSMTEYWSTHTEDHASTTSFTTLLSEIEMGHSTFEPDSSSTVEPNRSRCSEGYEEFESQCFNINHTTQLSFDKAEENCQENNGRLAELKSPQFFSTYIKYKYPGKTFWFGASDENSEGVWLWRSGVPLPEDFPWGAGEPNDLSGEDCLNWYHVYQIFNDADCNGKNYFVCEELEQIEFSGTIITNSSGPLIYPEAGPDKAIDDNPWTYWNALTSDGHSHNNWYIIFEITDRYPLFSVNMTNYGDYTHDITNFKLEASVDNVNWHLVGVVCDVQPGSDEWQGFHGFTASGKYLKFTITQTYSGWQPWLREIKITGYLASTTSFTTPSSEIEMGNCTSEQDSSTTVEPNIRCGGEYNSSSGTIHHPLSGSQYENNQNCVWIIRATDPITITFVSFNTEIRYDYLYVQDGEGNESSVLCNFNGDSIPSPLQTRTNIVYLRFTSDSSVTRTGFQLQWEPSASNTTFTAPLCNTEMLYHTTTHVLDSDSTTESILSTALPDFNTTVESGCGGEYNSSSGMIRHPLSGSQYHNNQNCIWTIRASHPINITFVSFNTERSYDYLYVRDGEGNTSSVLCNFNGDSIPSPFQTRNNTVYLRFISDGSVTRTGFELQWEPSASNTSFTAPLCNTDMVYHTSSHVLESDSTTESILSSALPDSNTTVESDDVNCTARPMIETTKQTTAFATNSSITFSRLNITTESILSTTEPDYSTTLESGTRCGGEYNSSRGMIRHPLSGSQYRNNQNCIWIIRATQSISISFVSFNTETSYDYLYVRDGESNASPLLGTFNEPFNGDGIPSPVQTTTNAAHLRFTSDGSITQTGFELHWEPFDMVHSTTVSILSTSGPDYSTTLEPGTGCGGEYNSSSGIIHHPLNGSQYHNNQNCVWIIRAKGSINITFVSFDTEAIYDFLNVRDGEGNESLSLGKFDGDSIPSPVKTRTNVTHLQFISDSSVTRTGFELHWEPLEICPADYVEIGSHCVIIHNMKVNWDQAKSTCEENSAQLVSLMDPMALRDYVITNFPKSSFWIGGRYYRNPDGWQWLSGATFNSSFPWGINDSGVQQDKGKNQDCMILRYFPIQDEQEYVDNRCNKKNHFICEKPKVKRE